MLEERTIVAMYMNNRAVELLAQRELDRAVLVGEGGDAAGPRLPRRHQHAGVDLSGARPAGRIRTCVLRWLLGVEPDNVVALDNLVRVLSGTSVNDRGKACWRRG